MRWFTEVNNAIAYPRLSDVYYPAICYLLASSKAYLIASHALIGYTSVVLRRDAATFPDISLHSVCFLNSEFRNVTQHRYDLNEHKETTQCGPNLSSALKSSFRLSSAQSPYYSTSPYEYDPLAPTTAVRTYPLLQHSAISTPTIQPLSVFQP